MFRPGGSRSRCSFRCTSRPRTSRGRCRTSKLASCGYVSKKRPHSHLHTLPPDPPASYNAHPSHTTNSPSLARAGTYPRHHRLIRHAGQGRTDSPIYALSCFSLHCTARISGARRQVFPRLSIRAPSSLLLHSQHDPRHPTQAAQHHGGSHTHHIDHVMMLLEPPIALALSTIHQL